MLNVAFCENNPTADYFRKKLHLDVWLGFECTFHVFILKNLSSIFQELYNIFW